MLQVGGSECEDQASILSCTSNTKLNTTLDSVHHEIYPLHQAETSESSYIAVDGFNNENIIHYNNIESKTDPVGSKACIAISEDPFQVKKDTKRQGNEVKDTEKKYQNFNRIVSSSDSESKCHDFDTAEKVTSDTEEEYQVCNKRKTSLKDNNVKYQSCNRTRTSSATEGYYHDCNRSEAPASHRELLDVSWSTVNDSSSKWTFQTWWNQSEDAIKIIINLSGVEDYSCRFLSSRLIFT